MSVLLRCYHAQVWLTRTGFLEPSSLSRANANDGCATSEPFKSLPAQARDRAEIARDRARSDRPARLRGIQTRSRAQFDAKDLACTQHFATSKDGTKVPYFQLGPKEMKLDGSHPTLLDGYGGFEISLEPGAATSSFNHHHVAIACNHAVIIHSIRMSIYERRRVLRLGRRGVARARRREGHREHPRWR